MTAAGSREIMSTLFSRDAPMAEWLDNVDMVSASSSRASTIAKLVAHSRRYRAVVLDGSARRDQIAAALIASVPRPPAIVVADATWKSDTGRVEETLNRLGVRAIDGPRVTFCVLSNFEVDSFRRTWGPLRGNVSFVPWPYTLPESELDRELDDDGHVFAGGNSLRDYDTLIAAAASLTAPVEIATDVLRADQRSRMTANVDARPLPQQRYDERLRSAAVVVVPLQPRHDRSSGQTTYVNAMALGKALVVTDAPGVRDYIEHERTGLLVPPGDPGAMAAAIQRLLDDPDRRRQIGTEARARAAAKMSLRHYARRLLDVVDEALAR